MCGTPGQAASAPSVERAQLTAALPDEALPLVVERFRLKRSAVPRCGLRGTCAAAVVGVGYESCLAAATRMSLDIPVGHHQSSQLANVRLARTESGFVPGSRTE